MLAQLKTCAEVTAELKPKTYFGNHIVDAKFIPVKTLVIAKGADVPRSRKRRKLIRGLTHISGCDYETHDLPLSMTASSEDFRAYDRYFSQLKNLGYPLQSLTCDDKLAIRQACAKHFPEAKIQLCVRHYREEIARKLKVRAVERTILSFEKQLHDMGESFFYPTCHEAQARAAKIVNHIADLEHQYRIGIQFSRLMDRLILAATQKAYAEAAKELNTFLAIWRPVASPIIRQRINTIIAKYTQDTLFLFTSLRHPELHIPRTTNLQEGYHSHWELRLASIRGFESEQTAAHYMNALVLKKRFSILVSCKGRFKPLNGKSPLEHGGGLTAVLKDWIQFCIRA